MTTISERRQHLDFDGTWRVVKWDDASEFKGSLEQALHNLPSAVSVKAADAVGVRRHEGHPPILMIGEFKDFDYPAIPPEHRLAAARLANTDELMAALVRKVIDTLAGSAFAHDANGRRSPEVEGFRRAVSRANVTLLVLFCIEVPRTQSVAILPWTKRLQERLKWLGPKARVIVTSGERPFTELGVAYRV